MTAIPLVLPVADPMLNILLFELTMASLTLLGTPDSIVDGANMMELRKELSMISTMSVLKGTRKAPQRVLLREITMDKSMVHWLKSMLVQSMVSSWVMMLVKR